MRALLPVSHPGSCTTWGYGGGSGVERVTGTLNLGRRFAFLWDFLDNQASASIPAAESQPTQRKATNLCGATSHVQAFKGTNISRPRQRRTFTFKFIFDNDWVGRATSIRRRRHCRSRGGRTLGFDFNAGLYSMVRLS